MEYEPGKPINDKPRIVASQAEWHAITKRHDVLGMFCRPAFSSIRTRSPPEENFPQRPLDFVDETYLRSHSQGRSGGRGS